MGEYTSRGEFVLIVNRYKGSCTACGTSLKAGQGFAFKGDDGKYVTVCKGRICVEKTCSPSEVKSYERHMERAQVRKLHANGTIEMPYELATQPLVRAMPGAKFDYPGDKQWHVSTAQKDRRRVLELAHKIQLDVDPALQTIEISDRIKQLKEDIKDSGLYAHQEEGTLWIAEQDTCLLADEMGLGKTPQMLMEMDEEYGHLVVCPNQCVYTWLIEGMDWRSDLAYTIIEKSKDFRIPEPGEVIIISYGMLPEWVAPKRGKRKNTVITEEQREALAKCVTVYDEIHLCSNPKTKRSWLCRHLTRLCDHAVGLTGTPVRNRELELWNIFQVLGLEKAVFDSFPAFIKMMDGKKSKWGYEFGGNIRKDVPERLRRVMLRRLKKDVLDLPPKVFRPIFMDVKQNIKDELDNAWDLYRQSSEFRSGKIPEFTEMSTIKKDIAVSHIPAMLEEVKNYEAANIPLIVVSCHIDPIKSLKGREGWDVIMGGMSAKEKQDIVAAWQAGKLKGLGVTLKAASTGITLTYGSHILRVDLDWVPDNNAQFEDRIHRISQTEVCVYRDIVSDHPLLRHIHKLNHRKLKLAHKSMEKMVAKVSDPNETPGELVETEEDYEARVVESKKVERQRERAAVLHNMADWKSRFPYDDSRIVSPERATAIRKAADTMLAMGTQPQLRRRGKVVKGPVFASSHKHVMSLLAFAGLETHEELLLAETILTQYKAELESVHPDFFG